MTLKVHIDRADFFSLVSQAYGLIEKRSVMPILSKILLSAEKKHLHIQATDQDNSLQSQVPAQVQSEGQIVVDAQNLFEILKELDDKELILISEGKGKKIQLKQGSSVFYLMGWDINDFPSFPPFSMKEVFDIKASALKQAIDKTVYCTSADETRYHLTGLFFEPVKEEKMKKRGVRLVATDGHRLALSECLCTLIKQEEGVIIPKKGIMEVKKMLSHLSSESNIEVAIEKPRILFRQENTVLSIRLVEGTYPNYQQLIPKEKASKLALKINSGDFSQALRRVSLLSNNRFKGVTFQVKGKKIHMEAEHPELGSAQNEVEILEKTGVDLKIRFNARYILEALNGLNCKEINLELKDKTSPCLIFPSKEQEKAQIQKNLCVIMPMQI